MDKPNEKKEPEKQDGNERGNWGSQIEFVLTCVGFAVGLGNVWRFPYLCFKNGGGAFLVPYFICLALIGIPFFFLELCLGQFCSLGPIKVWRINPWFKGLGIAMLVVSALISVYYAVIIGYCTYYFFASMRLEVPWKYCEPEWSTCHCRDGNQNDTLDDPWNGTRQECCGDKHSNPKRRHRLTWSRQGICCAYIGFVGVQYQGNVTYNDNTSTTASDEYFHNRVLNLTSGIDDLQGLKWDVTLCNLFVWLLTFCVLSKGIKSLGKVVYFTAIFPYFLLTAMLVRAATLDGHMEGLKFYLTPNFSRLNDAEVWSDAAVQIFYSFGTCLGSLIAMSSYNDFHNNSLRDAFLIPIINCGTSFYAGMVTFMILGFMAHQKETTVQEVATGGPGLAFIVYPEALAQMPVAPLWAILFFLMMMILGFSTIFSVAESIITGIFDQALDVMSKDSRRLYLFRLLVCLFFFIMGIPMTTKGGLYVLNLMDTYVGGFPLLIMGILELVVIIYIYGYSFESLETNKYPKRLLRGFYHFKANIELMLGQSAILNICFYYFGVTWCFISPFILVVVVILKALQYQPITLGSYIYPEWANIIGWMIVLFSLILIPGWMVYYSMTKDISMICNPKGSWGPSNIAKKEWSVFIHPLRRVRSRIDMFQLAVPRPTTSKSEPAKLDQLAVVTESPMT